MRKQKTQGEGELETMRAKPSFSSEVNLTGGCEGTGAARTAVSPGD